MLNKLPVKKDHLLLVAAVLMFILCCKLAFNKTISAWQTNRQLRSQLIQANDLGVQPDYLYRKNINLSKIIDQYKADTVTFRNNSISTLSILADKANVKLSEVPTEAAIFHNDKFIVQKLTLEGDHFSLTKTLHAIQNTPGVGLVRAVTFKMTRVPGNIEQKKLTADIYLEIAK